MSLEQANAIRARDIGLACLLVLGAALHFFGGNVADPDLWAHLQYGRTILAGQGLPTVEIYSYTAPGAPFYDHEWLTDAVTAGVFDTFGPLGLALGKILLLGAMLVLMLDAMRVGRDVLAPGLVLHPLTVAAAVVLGAAVIGPGATFRAQLFTMSFLALEVALLARAERDRSAELAPWPLVAVPLLLVAWANLHGGFLVGVGLFGLYLGAAILRDVVEGWRGGDLGGRANRLIVRCGLGLAALAAPLLNPYGVELYTYLARTLDMHGQISEWYPVEVFSDHFLRFKILVALTAVAAFVLRPKTWSGKQGAAFLWRFGFCLLAAYMAFRHQRHTVLFGIVATPLVVPGVEVVRRAALRRFPALRPRPPVFAAAAVGAAALALFQIGGWANQVEEHGAEIRYGRLDYPVDAVEFLKRHGFEGNLAMPFEWGAYAITKMAPQSRVFIDGRFEAVYPKQVIDDYFAFMNGTEGWERLLDAYPTDVVVVQRKRNIHPRLFERADLQYVYSDPASLVFVRPGPRTADALARMAASHDRNDFPRLATYFP